MAPTAKVDTFHATSPHSGSCKVAVWYFVRQDQLAVLQSLSHLVSVSTAMKTA